MGQNRKPWGGRFDEATDPAVERFTASVSFDKTLARYDIRASIAHARMLGSVGLLAEPDVEALVRGLESLAREIDAGTKPGSEIAAPDVTVLPSLTIDIVLQAGETQQFVLTYAPTRPNLNDGQSSVRSARLSLNPLSLRFQQRPKIRFDLFFILRRIAIRHKPSQAILEFDPII